MNKEESPWRSTMEQQTSIELISNSNLHHDGVQIQRKNDNQTFGHSFSNAIINRNEIKNSKETLETLAGNQYSSQNMIRSHIADTPLEPKIQSNYRGTCQWSQALFTSANSINRSSSSHSSERFQARLSPSSETPSWDGVSVWVPNTSISRTSRPASKSPKFSRHQISVTPRSTRFKTDTNAPSLDSSNENIDQATGNLSLRGSNSKLLRNSPKRYEIDSSPGNYQLTRNASLRSQKLSIDNSSDKLNSNSDFCRHKPKNLQSRQQVKKHNSFQESKPCGFKNIETNLNNIPQRQLCPDFFKPLEILRKKLELLEEQERLNISHSDSERSACHEDSISSFFSFEDSLDRALEEQDYLVDNSMLHKNRLQENSDQILENIEIPEVSEINKLNWGDNRINYEVIQIEDNKTCLTSKQQQSYAFVPNGQFLKLIEDKETMDKGIGVTQVVLNSKENQNLNYFLKLHSNKNSENQLDRQSDASNDKRLLNLRGLLADIKKTIDNSGTNISSSENNDSVPISPSNQIIEVPFEINHLTNKNIPLNETNRQTSRFRCNTRSNTSNNMFAVNTNNPRMIKNQSSDNLNYLERQDSYRKLSPEKIMEISEWAEKTVSGFIGGNGKTDEIRVKDLLFKKSESKSWTPTKEELRNVLVPQVNNKTQIITSLKDDKLIFNSLPSKRSSCDKHKSFLSSTETSFENSREARMGAIELSFDNIFDEFLERTLLSKMPYIDDYAISPKDEPLNESSSSLPVLSTTQPVNYLTNSFSTSNLLSQSISSDKHNLKTDSNVKYTNHLITSTDENLTSSKLSNVHDNVYNSGLNSLDHQQQNNSFQLMTFRNEVSLLRSRLMERIQCLESEHAVKSMRMERKCFHLEQIVVETFGLNKINVTTQPTTSPFRKKKFVTNIKKVVMTCDSGDTARSFVKSQRGKDQMPSSSRRMETMIDGSESESGEFVLHQLPSPSNTSGGDDDDDGSNEEVYVIVLKDGITIEGIHATVPQGMNAPIKVHQQDLKNSFEAAFRALCDVTGPSSSSWTPSVSASNQNNQETNYSQDSSSDDKISKQQQQQQQHSKSMVDYIPQQIQQHHRLPHPSGNLLYYHCHINNSLRQQQEKVIRPPTDLLQHHHKQQQQHHYQQQH